MLSSLASGIYRVVLEAGISEDENVDNCDKLGKVFNLFSLAVAFEFRKLLACRWLEICPHISYAELLSRFVTICYDILLDDDLVCLLVSMFIFPTVCNWDLVSSALVDYRFDVGSFYYGGFLPCHELMVNGWFGQLLHELKMGLICDTMEDIRDYVDFLLYLVPDQYVDKAWVVFEALHSLITLGFLFSTPARLALPLKVIPPPDSTHDPPEERTSSWFLYI